eukprot:TRINITY_DN39576_c0_g1_i1.p2 TRINITY_DN39576_c0_g1~~TRINITY_DN39576_c0_g1_i1.p2  ORF type:complete len:115 (+),score=12.13 TRINITY_DN39576_c0_g1_i1:59-403(+)
MKLPIHIIFACTCMLNLIQIESVNDGRIMRAAVQAPGHLEIIRSSAAQTSELLDNTAAGVGFRFYRLIGSTAGVLGEHPTIKRFRKSSSWMPVVPTWHPRPHLATCCLEVTELN